MQWPWRDHHANDIHEHYRQLSTWVKDIFPHVELARTSEIFLDRPPVPAVPVALNIALKLPVFRSETSEVWFAQADAQFAIRLISISKTKFYHAVASLPQDVAAQLLDLIHVPPAGNPYEVLKDCVTMLYSLNDYPRFEALVSLPLAGDQQPSHLMNRMLSLLQDD